MHSSKIVALFAGLLFFVSVAVVVDAAGPTLMNVQSACLKATRCDQANGQCEPSNTYPLVQAHRSLLEVIRSLNSSTVFVHECIRVSDTEEICLPVPIVADSSSTSGWKFKNYRADNNTPVVWASGGKEFFQNAKVQECIASYTDSVVGTTECNKYYYGGDGVVGYFNEVDGEWSHANAFLTNQNYQFNGLYLGQRSLTPVTVYPASASQGSTFEWGSSTANSYQRSFRILAFSNPIEGTSGSYPSDKVGQLGFMSNEEVCPTTSNYDPFGQVFDRSSLQPVKGARVALYKEVLSAVPGLPSEYVKVTKQNTPEVYDTFTNPKTSDELGAFSFAVPPGTYKALVVRNGGNIPDPLSDISVNDTVMDVNATELGTSVMVFNQGTPAVLYPEPYQVTSLNSLVNLPEIVEGNSPERRDISVVNLPVAPGKTIWVSRTINSAGDNVLTGLVNKPLGLVTAKKQSDGTVLGNTNADIEGHFTLVIPANVLPRGRAYQIEVSARQFELITPTPTPQAGLGGLIHKLLGYFSLQVHAQSLSTNTVIQPRLNYLEGYAYDNGGAVLKNATVTIFDKVLGVPVYTTQTDNAGYYKVTSENLPQHDYTISYTPEGSKAMVNVDQEKFYTQNEKFIEAQDIDVNRPQYGQKAQEYLTAHPELMVSTTQNPAMDKTQDVSGSPNMPTKAMDQKNPVNQLSPALLMYVAILLLLIVGAGLLIMYYVKRKQEPHLYE